MGPNVIVSSTTLSAASTGRSSMLSTENDTVGAVQVVMSGYSSGTVTFSVQRTLDGTNYDEWPNTTNYPSGQTKSFAANGTWITETLDFGGCLGVAVNVSAAAAAGTLTITKLGKSDRNPSE